MRVLIVHNPRSGPRSDELYAFIRALGKAGDEVVLRFLGDDLDAADAVADARSFDRVVVSGGDGTISSLLYQLRDTHVPILVFPSGTANLFFNNIGNASEPAVLAETCRTGRTVTTDMGELEWEEESGEIKRHGFINIAGTGFDADIMSGAEESKAEMGQVAYFISAFNNLTPEVAHFTIECDDGVHERDGIGCMVGNTAVIQNGVNLFPDCSMTDGLIDVAVIETKATLELAPTAFAVVIDREGKTLGRPQFAIYQTREVKITSTPSLNMEYDGEVIKSNTGVFSARALPRCLDLIVDRFSKLI